MCRFLHPFNSLRIFCNAYPSNRDRHRLQSAITVSDVMGSVENQLTSRIKPDPASEKRPWNKSSAYTIKIKSLTTPKRLSQHRSKSSLVPAIYPLTASHLRPNTPSSPLTALSLAASACKICYNLLHLTLSCPVLTGDALTTLLSYKKATWERKTAEIAIVAQLDLGHASPTTDAFITILSSHHYQAKAQEVRIRQNRAPPPAKY